MNKISALPFQNTSTFQQNHFFFLLIHKGAMPAPISQDCQMGLHSSPCWELTAKYNLERKDSEITHRMSVSELRVRNTALETPTVANSIFF